MNRVLLVVVVVAVVGGCPTPTLTENRRFSEVFAAKLGKKLGADVEWLRAWCNHPPLGGRSKVTFTIRRRNGATQDGWFLGCSPLAPRMTDLIVSPTGELRVLTSGEEREHAYGEEVLQAALGVASGSLERATADATPRPAPPTKQDVANSWK